MSQINKVIACFKELEFPLDIEEFEHRIIIQKVIFLLNLNGVTFNYDFELYVRGPYCTILTKDIYNNKVDIEKQKGDIKLTTSEKTIINRLKEKLSLKPSILEIAATYAYFIKIEQLNHIESSNKVKKMKHFFSVGKIYEGISKVREYLLLD